MTKLEFIKKLKCQEYLDKHNDERLNWLIDLYEQYANSTGDYSLDNLFYKYFNPNEVIRHLRGFIHLHYTYQELSKMLEGFEHKTHWAYYNDNGSWTDINDAELELLRKRLISELLESMVAERLKNKLYLREEEDEID